MIERQSACSRDPNGSPGLAARSPASRWLAAIKVLERPICFLDLLAGKVYQIETQTSKRPVDPVEEQLLMLSERDVISGEVVRQALGSSQHQLFRSIELSGD